MGSTMLTTTGQEGGAMTFAEGANKGQVFGIYTGVDKHAEFGSNLSLCVRITEEVVVLVDKF